MINSNKELAIVVLFWNNSDKTIKCLESLYKQKKQRLSIVLVDNNSEKHFTQNIFNWLKKNKIKKIETKNKNIKKDLFKIKKICFYIKNRINYGCGLGHNFGYKFCLKNGFKYIARIDNDMIVPNLTIFNLVNRMKKNNLINALSPKIMFVNRPGMIWYSGTKIGNNLKMQRACSINSPKGYKDNKSYKGLINTDAIAGCASIMRASKLRSSGLSDPEFFYGEEDTELSFRLVDSPESLKIDLDQKIYHHVSATVGENWGKNIYYNYKYRLLLVQKIGTFSDKFFGYSLSFLKLFASCVLIFKKSNSSKILQRYYALKHFFQNNYGDYDRINYHKINIFFKGINKETDFFDILKKIIFTKNKLN